MNKIHMNDGRKDGNGQTSLKTRGEREEKGRGKIV